MIRHSAAVQAITQEEARRIVDEEGFQDQRKKSSAHISFLREVMKRGQFDGGEPVRFAAFGGARFLINGQHRLEAIASGGGTQQVVVVTSECDTAEEAALLYSRIDRGRGRNISDALQAIGKLDEQLTKRQIMSIMSCAPAFSKDLIGGRGMMRGQTYASKSAEGRSEIMATWLPAGRTFYAAIGKPQFGNEKFFYLREVVMVALATFGDLPASRNAHDFWAGMASDDGLHANDPRKQCLEFLKKVRGKSIPKNGLYVAHGVTVCWNAWMRDDTLKLVKVLDDAAPLRIAGTRFSHRLEDGSLDISRAPAPAASRAPMDWPEQGYAHA